MAESLAEFHPTVMWKAELVNYKLGYLDKEIGKQTVEGAACFSLTGYRKWEEKSTK